MKAFFATAITFLLLFGCIATAPQQNQQPERQQTGQQQAPPFYQECATGMGCRGMMQEGMMGQQAGELEDYRPQTYGQLQQTQDAPLADGARFTLEAGIIKATLFGQEQYLYGYNSQIPGPAIRVKQGSKIYVDFKNSIDQPTTVHWHGLRLQNAFDGVPNVTQPEVQPGGSFTYELDFPDEGIYWYHPHVREEVQQERGLYGVIMVEPKEAGYFSEAGKEETVVLDDVLLGRDGNLFPFGKNFTAFAIMGRFGNQPLINGRESYSATVKTGEVLRLFFLNTANVRPFNISIKGTQMKMVGADSGKFEREFFADSFAIAPSERYIAEVAFEKPGKYGLYNINPFSSYKLGEIIVEGEPAALPESFLSLRNNMEISESIDPYRAYFDAPPDFDYELNVDIPGAMMGMGMMMEHTEDGIEWEDTMFGMNAISTSENLEWRIIDKKTGKWNMDASATVPVAKPFKIRLTNTGAEDSLHPMQHPIHLHGARFLVLSKDGVKNSNLAWEDTVLVPTGSTVEILSYFPNPGEWMLHCHVAEHLSSGMMTSIRAV